jgi:hypothetical protein
MSDCDAALEAELAAARPKTDQEKFARDLRAAMFDVGLIPLDDPVVFGSAVLKLHGLRDEIGDVDVFVPARVYARLRHSPRWVEQRPQKGDPPLLEARSDKLDVPFHVFHAWTSRDEWLDVPEAIETSERVRLVRCVRLDVLKRWKKHALQDYPEAREKHLADLRVLEAR